MRNQNSFVQAFMVMREEVDEANQRTNAARIRPSNVEMFFTAREGGDPRRLNSFLCNEVDAVVTLYADQSSLDNEMVVRERRNDIVTMKNTDNRIETFS